MGETLSIHETFLSVQGEAADAGRLCFFIRLAECDLRCKYCDTKASWKRGVLTPIDLLLQQTRDSGVQLVCVTGGEPMLQPGVVVLMQRLLDAAIDVTLETHGMAALEQVPAAVTKVLDVKLPGSFGVIAGVDKSELYPTLVRNLTLLGPRDQLKFVIRHHDDFRWANAFIAEHRLAHLGWRLLFSPSHGELDPQQLVDWMKADASPARLNLQLHKYIWGAHVPGV